MRYSSDNQTEVSIEYQRDKINSYCKENGFNILAEYIDREKTGTHDRRPEFQRMIDEIHTKPAWNTILIYKYDRLARNILDEYHYLKLFRDNGIKLISVTEPYDPSDQFSEFKRFLTAFNNELYSKQLGEHTHDAMLKLAQTKENLGGIPPLGYEKNSEGHFVINEHEAEAVRFIFDAVEIGYSYKCIAGYLNSHGYTTKCGNKFESNSFYEILRNDKYCGIFRWNKASAKDENGRRNSHKLKPEDEQIIGEGRVPKIITKKQFSKVQEILDCRSNGRSDSKSRRHYMLGGMQLIKCAECGRYMYGYINTSHGNKYVYYRCPNHKGSKSCNVRDISAASLEKFVAEKITDQLLKHDDIDLINDMLCSYSGTRQLRNEKKNVEESITRLTKSLEKVYTDAVVKRISELEKKLAKLEEEIDSCKKFTSLDDSNYPEIRQHLIDFLQTSNLPVVRFLIRDTVELIEVSNSDVTITLKDI